MTKYDFIKDIIEDNILIEIPVHDFDGIEIGHLKPITKKMIDNDRTIVSKLTTWRNQSSKHFFTTFIATEERTKRWLLNQVLNKSDKLLFLIYSNSSPNFLGHLGFTNFNNNTLELDNLVRGERGGDPQLIMLSELSLINWVYKELNVSIIKGEVLYRNVIALLLHKKVGFEINRKIYLKEVVDGSETKLISIGESEFKNDKLFKYIISLNKKKFYEAYNGLKYEN